MTGHTTGPETAPDSGGIGSQRWLLSGQVLILLAEELGVQLPGAFQSNATADAIAAGASSALETAPVDLRQTVEELRRPIVAIEFSSASVDTQPRDDTVHGSASTFTASIVLGSTGRVLVLVRRANVPLVEVSGGAEDLLLAALSELFSHLPNGSALESDGPSSGFDHALMGAVRVPSNGLENDDSRFQMLGTLFSVPTDTVRLLDEIVNHPRATLSVSVTAELRDGHYGVGVLLWFWAGGRWWSLDYAPTTPTNETSALLQMNPVAPSDGPRLMAPLIQAALG